MATEIELKCMMSQANLAEAEKWMLGVGAMRAHSVKLVNRYYDTPDRQLNKHKIALRIREKEGKFFQTLKTKGSSVGGLHQRNEWEWSLARDALDLSLLAGTAWPEVLIGQPLAPLFETNFVRQQMMLNWGDSSIEVALDRGEVFSGGQMMPIQELELELLSGSHRDILSLARQMAQTIPFHVSDVSKGERGYYLAGVLHYDPPDHFEGVIGSDSTSLTKSWVKGVDLAYLTGNSGYLVSSLGALMALKGTLARTQHTHKNALIEWLSKEYVRLEEILSLPALPRFSEVLVAGSLSEANALLTLLTTAD